MTNLLDSLKGMITPDLVSGLAGRLGESEGGVSKALAGALPLLLGGLIHKVGSGEGAQSVFSIAQTAFQQHGNGLGSAAGLLGLLGSSGGATGPGNHLLKSIFGGGADSLATPLSSYAGVSSASANSLLGLAGTAVPALLGQHAKQNNLNASALGNYLLSLKDQVAAMLPSGLSSMAGVLGLGGLGAAASRVTGTAGSAFANITNPAGELRRPGTSLPKSAGSRWPLILGALAVLALLFYFTRGLNKTETPTTTETAAMADTTRTMLSQTTAMTSAGGNLDSATAALKAGWAKLGPTTAIKLAGGRSINAPANGAESKLVAFINDATKPVDKTTWFSLDRLLFKTASSELLPDSQEQIDNVVAILNAYPAVKLKIGGYTDSRGNEVMNQKLSAERAKSVMDRVVAAGIAADRLASAGYGPRYPVASNDTPEGRQQNRRVGVRVTEK